MLAARYCPHLSMVLLGFEESRSCLKATRLVQSRAEPQAQSRGPPPNVSCYCWSSWPAPLGPGRPGCSSRLPLGVLCGHGVAGPARLPRARGPQLCFPRLHPRAFQCSLASFDAGTFPASALAVPPWRTVPCFCISEPLGSALITAALLSRHQVPLQSGHRRPRLALGEKLTYMLRSGTLSRPPLWSKGSESGLLAGFGVAHPLHGQSLP